MSAFCNTFTYTRKQISTTAQVKAELTRLSNLNPEAWYTFYTSFTSTTIVERWRKPDRQSYDAEVTYRNFGGFFHAGKIAPPAKSWVDTYTRPIVEN